MIINDTVYYTYRGSKFFRDGMDLTWHMFGMPQKTMLAHFLVKLSVPQPPQPQLDDPIYYYFWVNVLDSTRQV